MIAPSAQNLIQNIMMEMNGKNIHPWPPPAAAKQLYMCYAEDFVSNDIKKLGSDLESVKSISLENKLKFENDTKIKQNGYKSRHLDLKNSINCEMDPHLKEGVTITQIHQKMKILRKRTELMDDCQMEEPDFGENEVEYLGAISPDGEVSSISNNFADKIEIVYVQEKKKSHQNREEQI